MTTWDEVKKSLENGRYKWRTIRGIAKETKSSPEEIQKLLNEHSDIIIKSSISAESGEELFTTRGHYRRLESTFSKLASSVTATVVASSCSSGADEDK